MCTKLLRQSYVICCKEAGVAWSKTTEIILKSAAKGGQAIKV
jgi:hypothetical protein